MSKRAMDDLRYWKATDRATYKRILSLIETIKPNRNPDKSKGLEKLQGILEGSWSQKIDSQNMLVYSVVTGVYVRQCRGRVHVPAELAAASAEDEEKYLADNFYGPFTNTKNLNDAMDKDLTPLRFSVQKA
ncbi:MAG: type II toxin-antitoxin system YoeB family toxin [Clostridia bacterium]|nr:type II toxin-antitoxin system YoeB family toxin [Clostridia bacterium]